MDIVYYPDPRLRQVAKPVKKFDAALQETARTMFDIMYRCRGVGLAGPQAGLDQRIVVANITGDPEMKDDEKIMLNPRIVSHSGTLREEEGCLSLPGLAAKIARAQKVKIEYQMPDGAKVTETAEDFLARMYQHEVDHLDGILIIDKMSEAERTFYAPLLKDFEDQYRENRKPSGRVRTEAPAL